jgi:glycosyltransferase involved in cell wall biosynthesis
MRVAVVIPALNEAGGIDELVRETRQQPVDPVIVVDNDSTDGTAQVAAQAGARVVREPRRGYGYACIAGIQAAGDAADVLVFLDGDFSFLPSELPRLLAPIAADRADLVLGSRERGWIEAGSMPFHQRLGNRLVARLLGIFYGVPLTDLGPYRAIRRETLARLDLRERTFGFPTEMIVKAARQRARVDEVPVTYRARRAGKSKVGGSLRGSILATIRILSVTFRYLRAQG